MPLTVTPLPFEMSPTPGTAFPALKTPLPTEVSTVSRTDEMALGRALGRVENRALGNLEKTRVIRFELDAIRRLL